MDNLNIQINQQNVGDLHHHAVNIMEELDWLASVEARINQSPKLLKESVGKECCCIFRLPQSLVTSHDDKAYEPQIVSIGPYHHGKDHLNMVQEHKWRFLRSFLARTKQGVSGFSHLFQVIASREEKIRESYSEIIDMHSRDLIEMMVLDGCFMIELFYKVFRLELDSTVVDQEPILSMAWILPFIARDLLKLENQIPFFVLEILFEQTRLGLGENIPSLNILALGFFNSVTGRPIQVLPSYEHIRGKHVLDLFRLSLIPKHLSKTTNSTNVSPIPSAEKLIHLTGIVFKPRESSDSFLDIKFEKGVLEIPTLMLDDFSTSFLQNCVAFEQCYHHCSKHMTTYATFMGCLVNTTTDAGLLRDKYIIENYLGSDEQVAYFFNNLGKDMLTDLNESYLTELFEDVNEYSSKACLDRRRKLEPNLDFIGTKRPFAWLNGVVFVLLILAIIQFFLVVGPSVNAAYLKSSIKIHELILD